MKRISCQECDSVIDLEEIDWIESSAEYEISYCQYCGSDDIIIEIIED